MRLASIRDMACNFTYGAGVGSLFKVECFFRDCSLEDRIRDGVTNFLEQFHLSPLLTVSMDRFIAKNIADPTNKKVDRVRAWILDAINGRKSELPDPRQRGCPDIIPGLRAKPFWDRSDFPFLDVLESLTGAIREEL